MSANTLKKKLNYRHGYASRHCSDCDNFSTSPILGIGGADLGKQPRCKIIGHDFGKMYRINKEYIRDAFDGSEGLRRLRGY
ncbi:MAG: hypothetical protein Q7U88_14405 [Desulfocapsaceae bacterium]|nr:hypothetical protein [Desulfocapsaceae bacterium]